MKVHTVSDLIAGILQKAGVERIYGSSGDSLNGITEALRSRGAVEWVHMRREDGAAFAAAAEAHMTGKLAVCAGSCGPGSIHFVNGLQDAHRSRVPVLAIAAQSPGAGVGAGHFQEAPPEALFHGCSHYCTVVHSPDQLPRAMEVAIRAAVGQRGVAVVVIPDEVATMAVEGTDLMADGPALPSLPPMSRLPDTELDALAELLNSGQKVTLLCGRGCAGSHDALLRLAEALQSPIVHELGGKEGVEWDNPYGVGMTGLTGFASGYRAMLGCDALLMLGTDFPGQQFFPTKARIAQVDTRPEQPGLRSKTELWLVGDVGDTIEALLPRLRARTDRAYLDDSLAHYKTARASLSSPAASRPGHKPIHPQHLTKLLNDHAAADAVFTCDLGTPTIWAARCLEMNGRRRLIGSFVHGATASAMPHAIGAQASYPGRQVISLSHSDDSAMLTDDLLTLRQCRLAVKVVVFSTSAMASPLTDIQAAGPFNRDAGRQDANLAETARAAGIHGVRVESLSDLEAAVADVLAHPGLAVLDVVTATQDPFTTPHVDVEQVLDVSLRIRNAVAGGRGATHELGAEHPNQDRVLVDTTPAAKRLVVPA